MEMQIPVAQVINDMQHLKAVIMAKAHGEVMAKWWAYSEAEEFIHQYIKQLSEQFNIPVPKKSTPQNETDGERDTIEFFKHEREPLY